jgi:hypothetical protein
MESWWLILRDQTPIPGDHGGGLALMAEIEATRLFSRLLIVLHLSPLVDALDRFVAQQRGWLSRFVPDVVVLRRYP